MHDRFPESPSPDDLSHLVRKELEVILASSHFKNSRRCADFLSFVVNARLDGRDADIKERVIGVEVFGRTPGFETASDSIVRVRAAEVRNRLFRFYADDSRDPALRIVLPSGSYAPEFLRSDPSPVPPPLEPAPPVRFSLRQRLGVLTCGLVLAGGVWWFQSAARQPFDEFWSPLVTPKAPVLTVLPDSFYIFVRRSRRPEIRIAEGSRAPLVVPSPEFRVVEDFYVTTSVLRSTLALQRTLSRSAVPIDVQMSSRLAAANFQSRPAIILGAVNQMWFPDVNRQLRYSFSSHETPGGFEVSLLDRQSDSTLRNLSNIHPWAVQTKDYAIITLLRSTPATLLSVAGLNYYGTEAGAAFITDPALFNSLTSRLPAGWQQKNLQIVVETDVVNSSPTNPTAIAIHSF